MRRASVMSYVALALIIMLTGAPVRAAEQIAATLDLATVRVEITWVASLDEMNRLRRGYGQPPLGDPVFRSRLTAFSVLGKRDGEWTCLLFVPKPERVDDEHTLALGHEVAHCLLGDYHR
jgi:hypothetical protein